jgi:nicotinamidase-related amidase
MKASAQRIAESGLMFRSFALSAALWFVLAAAPFGAHAATIVDDWGSVVAPPPPALQSVSVDPATTALLVLDFVKQTCGGPRCQATVPTVAKFLQAARAARVPVIYSYTNTSAMSDTLPAVAPVGAEPTVVGYADKFVGSDLQAILTRLGTKTVIVMGMSAQGAVLYTASHAAFLGLNVVVPIDGVASEVPYAQQYVVWALANAPRVSALTKVTTTDRVTFAAVPKP